jgi:carboxypeptidase C (cathepsin A)
VEAAAWFLEFFTKFLEAYPAFKARDLYLTGESYGGHYIPYFAKQLKDSNDPNINLKGIAIGNGMTNVRHQHVPYADFANLPENLQYTKLTPEKYQKTRKLFQVCQYMTRAESPMVKGLATFNYCDFVSNMLISDDKGKQIFDVYDIRNPASLGVDKRKRLAENYYTFLNSPEVLNELKVEHQWGGFDDYFTRMVRRDWIIDCSVQVAQLLDQGLPVLIYAGDKDYICNWVGNKEWISNMSWSGAADWAAAQPQDYHGYGKVWKAKNLQFLVVFDAGHMVPHNQPANSLDMLNRFLAGSE